MEIGDAIYAVAIVGTDGNVIEQTVYCIKCGLPSMPISVKKDKFFCLNCLTCFGAWAPIRSDGER